MKSYFANTVEAAIGQARRELGPDAVLVTSRATAFEAAALGQYEVVFAADPPQAPAPGSGEDHANPSTPAGKVPLNCLIGEIRELRREFESWRTVSERAVEQPRWIAGDTELEKAFSSLVRAEVGRDLAQQFVAAAHRRLRSEPPARPSLMLEHPQNGTALDPPRVHGAVEREIGDAFRVDSSLDFSGGSRAVIALVGPPGAGKTAMIAKLAVRYGLAGSKPTLLVSLDTLRVAASEQLRWYASILGIGFRTASNNLALSQALDEHPGKRLILIDTPGFTARDLEQGCETAEFLARRSDIQKHLVLPATLRAADLAHISNAYRAFGPSRLVFTRMDETGVFGPVLSEAVRSGLPISFFGTGQRVPEDLEPAEKKGLMDRILPQREWTPAALSAA